MVKKWQYVKLFSSDTGTSRTDRRTDGRTDRRTELLYQYRASVCWRAIQTKRFEYNFPSNPLQSPNSNGQWSQLSTANPEHLFAFLVDTASMRYSINTMPYYETGPDRKLVPSVYGATTSLPDCCWAVIQEDMLTSKHKVIVSRSLCFWRPSHRLHCITLFCVYIIYANPWSLAWYDCETITTGARMNIVRMSYEFCTRISPAYDKKLTWNR